MRGRTAVLYRDSRIGGTEEYGFAADLSFLMQIPDTLRKCVCFLGYINAAGQRLLAGTAFFVSMELEDAGEGFPAFVYLVTAKHVIDHIRDKGAEPSIRVNLKDGLARWYETRINDWVTHPDDDSVDVAVLPLAIPPNLPLDYRRYGVKGFLTDEVIEKNKIGVGDEVFLTGLFINHYGVRANIPILRVGNIAAMPEEKVEVKDFGLIDAYLIEARSIGGLSGSPVFAHLGPLRLAHLYGDMSRGKPVEFKLFYLMGLMHGHFDVKPLPDEVNADAIDKEVVNMGIAIVVPASKILEVLDQPMLKKSRKEEEAAHRKRVQEKDLPTPDTAEAEEPFTKNMFQTALEQASRKVSESESKNSDKTE